MLADKPTEAEAVFREIYKTADGADQWTQSGEGIAKSLRAEDGNPVRAAAWWKTTQAEIAVKIAATQPAGAGVAAATRPASPASRPRVDPGMP